jgi:hypothetical protein
MSLAKEINQILDDMLAIQAESNKVLKEVDGRKPLYNQETGEKVTKRQILELAQNQINELKIDLNKKTNNGKTIKGIFNNQYYINDIIQDKLIAQNNKE